MAITSSPQCWFGTADVVRRQNTVVLSPSTLSRNGNWSFGNATQAATPLSSDLLAILSNLYSIPNRAYCERLINQRPRVYDLLVDAFFRIRATFGNSQLRLEHFSDPEGSTEMLFILVPTSLSVTEARRLRNELDKTWWLLVADQASDLLNFDVEYV